MRFVVFCLLLCLLTTAGQAAESFAGTWVVRLGGRVFWVVKLEATAGGYAAQVDRPTHFNMIAGGLDKIRGETRHERYTGVTQADGGVDFTGGDVPFELRRDPSGAMLLHPTHLKLGEVWRLDRWQTEPEVAGDWPQHPYYPEPPGLPDNPELAKMFAEDQSDRMTTPIDWKVVTPRDNQRMARIKEMVAAGDLRSASDYTGASFLFQHGSQPQEYLMAHTLAMKAIQLGDRSALWIACASLDRYLQSVGQPQIYGTQYKKPGASWTQTPIDETLISDGLRKQLGVPVRADQLKRQEEMNKTP